ncbi:hypothetical protein FACS1894102_0490 [Spirochaetia bacterium]|nr:hypothetical protein FACS1894102_0490 [Spirochaetia bacterium]
MVLEHIQDLNKTIDILKSITVEGGLLIISVPDMTKIASNELPYQEFSREHINYFTPQSLSNLILKHGFINVFFKTNNGELVGYFKKQVNCVESIKLDTNRHSLQNYIKMSDRYEKNIYSNLLEYEYTSVIIWGLGTFTQRLLANNILKNIVALVDSNTKYIDKEFNNIQVISPSELKKYSCPIIIATSFRYIDSIKNTIQNDLKLSNKIIMLHKDYDFKY